MPILEGTTPRVYHNQRRRHQQTTLRGYAPKVIVAVLLAALPAAAQRGYPRIETVYPGAVARGETTEVLLRGRYNLQHAEQILFDGGGISAAIGEWSAEEVTEPPQNKLPVFATELLRIKVTVAADARPGIRPFRVLTKGSVSALAHLLVSPSPVVNEAESNDSNREAQSLGPAQTVNGLLDKEADLDVYQIEAKAGETLNFTVYSARLQHPVPQLEKNFADLTMSLRDSADAEIAAADDWHGQDPELSHTFEKSGVYYLHLREARYHSGKNTWWYALSVDSSPRVTSVFPSAVKAGSRAKLQLEGFNLAGNGAYEIDIPADAREKFSFVVASDRGESYPVDLLVTDLITAVEPSGPHEFTPIQVPAGVSGRIASDGETDRYRFSARKNDRLEFLVQRGNAAIDPLMEIRDASGRLLAARDDLVNTLGQGARGELAFPVDKNARIEWTTPSDGEYEVHVRDANFFGGKDYVYHLIARAQEPDFVLILDDDRMPAGPGGSYTSVVTLERRNGFEGAVELAVRELPKGLVAEKSVIPPGLNQGNIVITALPDARLDASSIEVHGIARLKLPGGESRAIERVAQPFAPMGQAGNRSFYPVQSAVAAAVEGNDIIMEAHPKKLTLHPGESATVEIRVTRDHYDGPIEMNVVLWNLTQTFSKFPPGMIYEEKNSKTSLGPGETVGKVTFRVQDDAPPIDDYLMTVLGQITYNRIFMTRVAAYFRLTIEPDRTQISEAE